MMQENMKTGKKSGFQHFITRLMGHKYISLISSVHFIKRTKETPNYPFFESWQCSPPFHLRGPANGLIFYFFLSLLDSMLLSEPSSLICLCLQPTFKSAFERSTDK